MSDEEVPLALQALLKELPASAEAVVVVVPRGQPIPITRGQVVLELKAHGDQWWAVVATAAGLPRPQIDQELLARRLADEIIREVLREEEERLRNR